MTLNVTVLMPIIIYQSADFRLTDFNTGELITDRSAKTVALTYWSWDGFITYTGVGRWRDRDVSNMVAEWLTGRPELSMAEVANIVEAKGTALLRDYERFYPRQRHTFTLAGFEDGQAQAYVISNFEDCFGSSRNVIDNHLTTTSRALRRGAKATVIVTGRKSAVPVGDRRVLGSVAAKYPGDGLRIRRRMEVLNAAAACRSQGRVSADCVVLSFRPDGTGAMQLNRDAVEAPPEFPHISNGIDVNRQVMDSLRGIGLDTSQLRTLQGGFVSSIPSRSVATPTAPCQYAIIDPNPANGYHLSEITTDEFELMSARKLSDRGEVVGTGRSGPGQPEDIPWSWFNGQVSRLDYTGRATAVDEGGQVVVVLQEPGTEQATLYSGAKLIAPPVYQGQRGTFASTSSSASAINSFQTMVGEVRGEAGQGGPSLRAAMFRVGQPTVILEGSAAESECRAVDINEHGQVLVNANPAIFDARSVLWNPEDGSWTYVGDETTNVYPIALNDDGMVLGQARNEYGQPVAVICRPGGRWERLDTDDGWIAADINNRGEVIGRAMIDRLDRPWLRRPTGQIVLLPYIAEHNHLPTAINNFGQIAGGAGADHGWHAIVWNV